MSVYIKSMMAPRNCEVCDLRNGCEMSMPLNKRPFDCPIIELPPHGDLIDRDELLSANRDTFTSMTELKIEFAPVIIPSNSEGSDDG